MNKHGDTHTHRYISLANAMPRLTLERELELARAWQEEGNRAAADTLIRANMRYVIPHALRYRRQGPTLSDLISQGNLALMSALDRFEPSRGLRFITYANHWIRAEMLALVLSSRSMVGGGRGHQRGRYVFKLQREHAHLTGKLGSRDEVCAILGQRFGRPTAEIADILARLERRDGSLDAPGGESGGTLADTLASDMEPHDERVELSDLRSELRGAVAEATVDLDERERFIVEHRLMADVETRQSLVDIGKRFGVSRERARQIEARLKDKLRKRLKPLAGRWELDVARAA